MSTRPTATARLARHAVTALTGLIGLAGAWSARANDLFVTTTTYEITGSCSTMGLAPPYSTQLDRYTIHSDAVVRRGENLVFVVNRQPANNILVLDSANDYAVVKQFALGAGTDPTDIDLVATDRAYVPLYNTTAVRIVHPLTGATLGSIDLSSFADADGLPEIDQVVVVGTRAFVSLQRLDRNNFWVPAGGSGLAVIDVATDALVDADPSTPAIDPIRLQLQNPYWDLRYDTSLYRVIAICPGAFGVLDGGIEAVDPFTLRSARVLVTEAELQGELNGAAIVSSTLGYAIVSDASSNTCLVRFNPQTGERLGTGTCTNGFNFSDLEVSTAGRLFVGDRTPAQPGIRVFDAFTAQPLLTTPVNVGLPPFDMVLLESVATAAPPPTPPLSADGASLRAYPNPFNPRVTIELAQELDPPARAVTPASANPRFGPTAAGSQIAWLRISDLRGRTVARLLPSGERQAESGARVWIYRWDGTDLHGAALASGNYLARAEGSALPAVRLALVR